MEERLQKLLSAAGVCSRRAAEDLITAGRVTVNGVPASLGERADPERDRVEVDGTPISRVGEMVYLMLHKPRGYVTTLADEQGRKTVEELVSGCGTRVWPVGRLDLNSEGLLLLTNDGLVTQKLIHPRHEVEKEYHVAVDGDVAQAVSILSGPMELDGVPLRPAKVVQIKNDSLSIVIHEGKNRQVRRMCAQAGLVVKRLSRVREGELLLGALKSGSWRHLTPEELRYLRSL